MLLQHKYCVYSMSRRGSTQPVSLHYVT